VDSKLHRHDELGGTIDRVVKILDAVTGTDPTDTARLAATLVLSGSRRHERSDRGDSAGCGGPT